MSPLLKTFLSLSSAEMALRAGRFLFFLLLANTLESKVFGEYIYLISLFTLIFVISDFGFSKLITKELSKRSHYDVYSPLIFRLIFFITLTLITFIFLHQSTLLILVLGFMFFLDAIAEMLYSIYRAQGKFHYEAAIKRLLSLSYLLVTLMLYLKIEISLAVTLFIIIFFYLLILVPHHKNIPTSKISFKFLKHVHKESFILLSAAILTIAYLRIDIFMIEYFLDLTQLSTYAIASKIIELSMILPMVISSILLPQMVKSKKIKKTHILQHFTIGIIVASIFYLVAPYLTELLFPTYHQSTELIKILAIGLPFLMINNYIFTAFIAHDLSKFFLFTTAFMLLSNGFLNYLYIPTFGLQAAAYSTLFTEFVGALIALALLPKLHTARKG